jgi:hypothetical protein
MYSSSLSLTLALFGGGWLMPHPGRFTSRKDPVPIVRKIYYHTKILCLFSITVLAQSLLSQSSNHHDPVLTHTAYTERVSLAPVPIVTSVFN